MGACAGCSAAAACNVKIRPADVCFGSKADTHCGVAQRRWTANQPGGKRRKWLIGLETRQLRLCLEKRCAGALRPRCAYVSGRRGDECVNAVPGIRLQPEEESIYGHSRMPPISVPETPPATLTRLAISLKSIRRRFLCAKKGRSNAPPFPHRSYELSEGLARRVVRRLLRIPGDLTVRVGARLGLFDLCGLRFVGALDLLDRGCLLASALAGVGAIGVIHGSHLSRIPNRDRLLAIAKDCLLNRRWGSKARMQFGECRRTDIRVVRCPSRLRAPWLQKRDVEEDKASYWA